jgi:hypothetical protein
MKKADCAEQYDAEPPAAGQKESQKYVQDGLKACVQAVEHKLLMWKKTVGQLEVFPQIALPDLGDWKSQVRIFLQQADPRSRVVHRPKSRCRNPCH